MLSKLLPRDLQLLVITGDSSVNTNSITSCLPPIERETLTNFQSLKAHVTDRSQQFSFILLFLDPNDQRLQSDLEDLKRTNPIFACFFCIKFKSDFIYRGNNVFPVPKQFLYQKLTTCIIQFLEQTSRELSRLDYILMANTLRRKANQFEAQRYLKRALIVASDALLIPMNVRDDQLLDHQEKFSYLCNDLCRENEPTVGLLSDVFLWDGDPDTYGAKATAVMCDFIIKSSPNRFYLLGNGEENLHPFSKKLLESESNQILTEEYDESYTFICCEPLTDRTRQNLSNLLGSQWESRSIQLRRLDDLQTDIRFAGALERAHLTRPFRILAAEDRLNRSAADLADNSVEISTQFQVIGQPVPISRTNSRNLTDLIQSDLS